MIVIPMTETVDGTALRGTLSLPDADGPHPLVVLHHGFGANRIEAGGLFPQLSRLLTARGLATAAFDRAGHGESDGDFAELTVSNNVEQSLELLQRLASRTEVDPRQLHLLGMSLGSVVASTVAAETDLPVRSLTLWSPAAIFHDDAVEGNFVGTPFDEALADGWLDKDGLRLNSSFYFDARTFDPYVRAAGYSGRVALISGELDDIVPVRYIDGYRKLYGARLEVTVVPNGDHLWFTIPARDELLHKTVSFITEV